jgi:hypothetical protein
MNCEMRTQKKCATYLPGVARFFAIHHCILPNSDAKSRREKSTRQGEALRSGLAELHGGATRDGDAVQRAGNHSNASIER